MSHKGINFVDEDDAWLKDFGQREQGPHVLFTLTELTKRARDVYGWVGMHMDGPSPPPPPPPPIYM